MNPTYRALAEFAQTWGLAYFVAVFLGRADLRAVAVAPAAVRRGRPHAAARGLIMADRTRPDVDAVTGTATTGHEWDGIRELNTPLPRWWLWLFYVTIVWAIGYWIVYPAWPLVSSYTTGAFGWHSRDAVVADLDALKAQRGADGRQARGGIAAGDRGRSDTRSTSRARRARPSFARELRAVPRRGRRRRQGLSQPQRRRLAVGRQARRDRSRPSATASAPATRRRGRARCRPSAATACSSAPRSRTSRTTCARSPACRADPKADLAAGKKIFADNCAVCHGADGKGNTRARRAEPDRRRSGSTARTKPAIVDGIWNGRGGVMPAWAGRLDDATIKALAVYVHSLGGGEK